MQAHDGSAWPKAALTLALMLGLGLIESPTSSPQASWAPRVEIGEAPGAGREAAGRVAPRVDTATCDSECLATLRQRLLDHHRQAAPVWVF